MQLYNEWFNHEEWWFNSSNKQIDIYLTNSYSNLLHDIYIYTGNDIKLKIASIILHDQIARHVYRKHNDLINKHMHISVAECKSILNDFNNITDLINLVNHLGAHKLCFILLPLRHTMNINNCNIASDIAWNIIKNIQNDNKNTSILKKFLKATYERRPLNDFHKTIFCRQPIRDFDFYQLNTLMYNNIDYTDILSHYPNEKFILKDIEKIDLSKYKCYTDIDDWLNNNNNIKNILISLSGGKDSMIGCFVFSRMRLKHNINIYAVHINYANRGDINDKEVMFLESWCHYLDIPIYVRNITEINRKNCMIYGLRELYETYTRNVRYSTYKEVWKNIVNDPVDTPVVFLGHNKDDCFENIMTNITQQKKYDNLLGMDKMMNQDNIIFIRPFLNTTKKDIIELAHDIGIPYFHTSTPVWSQRGQIRNNILPVIEKWDNRFESSMFTLATRMKKMNNILNYIIKDNIVKSIKINDNNYQLIVNIDQLKVINEDIYWEGYIINLLGINYKPSVKAIHDLINRLNNWFKLDFLHGPSKNNKLHVVLKKNLSITFIYNNEHDIMIEILLIN